MLTVVLVAASAAAAVAAAVRAEDFAIGYHPDERDLIAPLLPGRAVPLLAQQPGDVLRADPATAPQGLLAAVSLRYMPELPTAASHGDIVGLPAAFQAVCVSPEHGTRVEITVDQLANAVLGDVADASEWTIPNTTVASAQRRAHKVQAQSRRLLQGGPRPDPPPLPPDGTFPPFPPDGTFPPLPPDGTFPPLPPDETFPPLPPDDSGPDTGGGWDDDDGGHAGGGAPASGPVTAASVYFVIANTTAVRRALARGFRVAGISAARVPSDVDLPPSVFANPNIHWAPSVAAADEAALDAPSDAAITSRYNLVLSIGTTISLSCIDVFGSRPSSASSGGVAGATGAALAHELYLAEAPGAYEVPVPELLANISTSYVFWSHLTLIVNRSALCAVGAGAIRDVLLALYGGKAAVETMGYARVGSMDEAERLRSIALIDAIARGNATCADSVAATAGASFAMTADSNVVSIATGLGLQFFAERGTAPEQRDGRTTDSAALRRMANNHALVAVSVGIESATADSTTTSRRQGDTQLSMTAAEVSNLRQVPLAGALLQLQVNLGEANDGGESPSFGTLVGIPSCHIVAIFNGSVTGWDDPAFADANPTRAPGFFPIATINAVLDTATGVAAAFLLSLRAHEMQVCSPGRAAPSVPATPLGVQRLLGATRVQLVGPMDEALQAVHHSVRHAIAVGVESEVRDDVGAFRGARLRPYFVAPLVGALELHAGAEVLIDVYDRGAMLDPATFAVTTGSTSSSSSSSAASRVTSTVPVYPFVVTYYLVYQQAVDTAAVNAATTRVGGERAPRASCASARSATDFVLWAITARRAAAHVATENYLWLGGFDAAAATARVKTATCDGAPLYPEAASNAANVAAIVGGAVAGTAAVGGGIAALLFLVVLRAKTRDVGHAPKDASEPFAVGFTDVESSTTLWARDPTAMAVGLDLHHAVMRQAIDKRRCYEVKTIGDAFMVAFKDVEPAARFALDIQTAFVASEWGTEDFDEVYKDIDAGIREELGETQAAGSVRGLHGTRFVRQAEETPSEYRERWNGLRVRVGLNTGLGTIKLDPTTHRFDYYGTVVNAAARIESLATGGQVLVSDESYKALKKACGDALVPADEAASVPSEKRGHAVLWKPMGRHEVRGLTDGVQVVQIDPATLWTRAFPPIGKSMGGDLDTDLAEELASVADSDTELRSGGGDQQQKDVGSSAERTGWPSPAAMHASDGDAVSRDDGGYSPQAPPALLTDAAILTKEATNMSFDLSSGQAAARAKTQRRTLEMLAARNGQDYSDAVVDHHAYVDTMLSALPPIKRFETMRTIAEAWRCGGDLTATTSSGAFFPSFRRTAVSPAMAEADASFLAFDVAAKIETAYKTRRLVRKGVAALGGTLGPGQQRNRRRSSIGFAAMAMMRRSSGATGVSKETESVGKVPTFVDEDGAPLREEETHAHDLAKTDRIEVVSAGDAA